MPRVLSVGQCGFDHGSISRRLREEFGAEVVGADSFADALARLAEKPFDLVLVNRVSDVDGTSGLDLIQKIKGDQKLASLPVMLVSNFSEAQEKAQALGALPGFGKAELHREDTLHRIRAALAGGEG